MKPPIVSDIGGVNEVDMTDFKPEWSAGSKKSSEPLVSSHDTLLLDQNMSRLFKSFSQCLKCENEKSKIADAAVEAQNLEEAIHFHNPIDASNGG